MTPRSLLFLVLLALNGPASFANQPHFAPPNTRFETLPSTQTGEAYQLLVQLPPSYHSSQDQTYPTVYLTDAQWDFALVACIAEKLAYDNSIPEVILVGISYTGEQPNYGDLRERDLTPTTVQSINPQSGRAPAFLDFIENTLLPHVESRYRANPRQRVLGGSSYGGLFSLYALYQKPNLFARHIANSPAVQWDDGFLFRLANTPPAAHARLAISHGQAEYPEYRDTIVAFQNKLAAQNKTQLKLQITSSQQTRHAAASIDGWTQGLLWTLADLKPQTPSPLQAYFESQPKPIAIRE